MQCCVNASSLQMSRGSHGEQQQRVRPRGAGREAERRGPGRSRRDERGSVEAFKKPNRELAQLQPGSMFKLVFVF